MRGPDNANSVPRQSTAEPVQVRFLPLPNILEDYMQTMQNESDHVEHVVCEGSREHVLWWDSYGRHCSEKKCEINFQLNSTTVNIEQEITYLQEITYEHTGRVP